MKRDKKQQKKEKKCLYVYSCLLNTYDGGGEGNGTWWIFHVAVLIEASSAA